MKNSLFIIIFTFFCFFGAFSLENELNYQNIEKTPEVEFDINFCNIEIQNIPNKIKKGNQFKTPFAVKITDSRTNEPKVGVKITVSYPIKKINDNVEFECTEIISDSNGIGSFFPKDTSFSCKSIITFSLENEKEVSMPYLVTTNRFSWGGIISILDYTKNGKPIRDNSLSGSAILTAMMKNGFSRIGLIDFVDEIDAGNKDMIYKSAFDLIGTNTSFFIYGTVKYNGSIDFVDPQYHLPLQCEITCVNMKDGVILYETTVNVTGCGNSEWEALNNARTLLGSEIVSKIIFGI